MQRPTHLPDAAAGGGALASEAHDADLRPPAGEAPAVTKLQVRVSGAPPPLGANVAEAVYRDPVASGLTGMMIPPGGMKPTRPAVALSTVRTCSGPDGPLRAALVIAPEPVPWLMTNMCGPVVVPCGRSTKSPGT